ncbi:MAG: glycoside hydrolase family 88 protein [Chitinispirillaceae bacterium]|nr:glycoside hydrolase family 88 protein [Chitinispirillaceae bacterium]
MNLKILVPVIALVCISHSSVTVSPTSWAVDFSDAIIQRWPNSINDMTNKGWEYSNGIVLQGIERTYAYTNDADYLAYIKKYVDQFVNASGNISFDSTAQSLDKLHPAIVCLFLFQETGQQKYKLAADRLFSLMKRQPTNASGGFWHKERYPNQMWCDGVYMALPFFVKYGYRIGEKAYCDSMAAFQTLLLSSHAYVASKKLLVHGWDASKEASWADPANGCSPEIWCRAMGWFAMAMVEMLKYFPKDHASYDEMAALLVNIAEGIKNTQDPATGLWYQVMDKGSASDNWLESSGSGMFVYALKTAVDCGFLDNSYLAVAEKGWDGVKTKITRDNQNLPVINQFVGGMGIQNDYSGYVSQAKVNCPPAVHPHGYCGVLMAASAMELSKRKFRLTITTAGRGSVTNPTGEMFHDSGSTVTLTAVPASGFRLDRWSDSATGSSLSTTITMNNEKTVTANFISGSSTIVSPVLSITKRVSLHAAAGSARLTLALGLPQRVSVTIYDCQGTAVFHRDAGLLAQGTHELVLDTKNISAGSYLVRVTSGASVYTATLVVVNGG